MVNLPTRNSFSDASVDYTDNYKAFLELAERTKEAIRNEDIQLFTSLVKKKPEALFAKIIELKKTSSFDGRSCALDALETKSEAFCFDVGLCWATATGANIFAENVENSFKTTISYELKNRKFNTRKNVLAFFCGALQSCYENKELVNYLFDFGLNNSFLQKDFGFLELEIWGNEWSRKAKEEGVLNRFCSNVLIQSFIRKVEEMDGDINLNSHSMLKFAKNLGAPQKGWLNLALKELYPLFTLREISLRRKFGEDVANDKIKQWWSNVENLAVSICVQGPKSWIDSALMKENDILTIEEQRLQTKIDQAILEIDHAANESIKDIKFTTRL